MDKAEAEDFSPALYLVARLAFFPLHCIGNYSTCRAVAMGLADRSVGMLGVSTGALVLSLWRIALLFLPIWELEAQTAVETKPLYIWQTGTVHALYSCTTSPLGFRGVGGVLSGCMDVPSTTTLAVLMKY